MENVINELSSLDSIIKLLGIIISLFGIVIPLYKFLVEKKLKQKDLRFNTYHSLIQNLVEPKEGKDYIMLDKQIAICFELRNFPEYFEVTQRILKGLYEIWNKDRIRNEIIYTLKYIKIYNYPLFVLLRAYGLGFICLPIIKMRILSHYNYKSRNDELNNLLKI